MPREWADAVVDDEGRVERILDELCVLRSLREAICRREICPSRNDRGKPSHFRGTSAA